MEVFRPAAIRAIAMTSRRTTPPVPLTLAEWPAILNSPEWGPRLLNCNGTESRFFQGPLEVLSEDGGVQFVGVIFCNTQFLHQMNEHMSSVDYLCITGTSEVRPANPPGIAQFLTVQIIFNYVVNHHYLKHLLFIIILVFYIDCRRFPLSMLCSLTTQQLHIAELCST